MNGVKETTRLRTTYLYSVCNYFYINLNFSEGVKKEHFWYTNPNRQRHGGKNNTQLWNSLQKVVVYLTTLEKCEFLYNLY